MIYLVILNYDGYMFSSILVFILSFPLTEKGFHIQNTVNLTWTLAQTLLLADSSS